MKKTFSLLCCLVLLTACSGSEAALTVTNAWARPGNTGENSAIYFVIDNPTREADTLLSAACDAAEMVELHQTSISSEGVMMMEHQDSVPVPTGAETVFQPGGLHVMLMGLTRDLKAGDVLALTLTFETAGTVQVEVEVMAP